MRKDDPSSRRPRRRKSVAAALPPELQGSAVPTARPTRKVARLLGASLDCDFGLALCLMPSLRGKRLPDA